MTDGLNFISSLNYLYNSRGSKIPAPIIRRLYVKPATTDPVCCHLCSDISMHNCVYKMSFCWYKLSLMNIDCFCSKIILTFQFIASWSSLLPKWPVIRRIKRGDSPSCSSYTCTWVVILHEWWNLGVSARFQIQTENMDWIHHCFTAVHILWQILIFIWIIDTDSVCNVRQVSTCMLSS